MKKILIFKTLTLFIYIILAPFASFCQLTDTGSLKYLHLSNGFKQIKLGADAKRLGQLKLTYLDDIDSLDADSCHKFCYNDDDILDLGNGFSLNLVGLRTYKDKIVNIYLFFPRTYGYAILRAFEANYGKCTQSRGDFMYDWSTDGVTLSLLYKPGIEMGVAIFTSKSLEKQLASDNIKRKERQLLAQDVLGSL